jgi:hypothetical protein
MGHGSQLDDERRKRAMQDIRRKRLARYGTSAAGAGLAVAALLGFSNTAFAAKDVDQAIARSDVSTVALTSTASAPLFSAGVGDAPKPYTDRYDAAIPVDASIDGRVIEVEFHGRVGTDVRLYVDGYHATQDLDDETVVTVTRTDAAHPDGVVVYRDRLSELPTGYDGAGASAWVPGDAGARSARYTFGIDTSGHAAPGATVSGLTFRWEAQRPR